MGKRVVDDASLSALADELRAASGRHGKMVFPDDFMARAYAAHAAGYEDGLAVCAAKHFVHSFVGDGSGSYSFHVPFEPDVVQIMGFDPAVQNTTNALALVVCDARAFGLVGGFTQFGSGVGGIKNLSYTTTGMLTRYSRSEDGTITIKNIGGTTADVFYAAGFVYTAIAVKYTDQTDKARITEFVNRLTGSGKVTMNQAKVNAVFTDDEWAALIAAKPNWTFSWI